MLVLAGLRLEMVGLLIVGFEIVGLVIVGFEIVGLVTSKFEIVGFEIVGFEMVGFVIVGFVGSGFSVVELDKPFGTSVPWGAVISAIFTVTLAVGFVEVTNTGREALERGGILRSSVVNWANCRKDAFPPGGWLAIVIRKLLIKLVVFCVTTANARWKGKVWPLNTVVPSCLVLPGAPKTRPLLMGAV